MLLLAGLPTGSFDTIMDEGVVVLQDVMPLG